MSPVSSEYSVAGSPHHLSSFNESGISQHLQQLHLQQMTSSSGNSSLPASGGASIVQGTGRPMGSITNGTPLVSAAMAPQHTPMGFFSTALESTNSASLPPVRVSHVTGGSIMQGTPCNLPLMPNTVESPYANQQSVAFSAVPSFGGGSITQGTPVNRSDRPMEDHMDGDAMETEIMDMGAPSCEALDLRTVKSRMDNDQVQNLSSSAGTGNEPCGETRSRKSVTLQPHPQISITDEQGEVTAMSLVSASWNAYGNISARNGSYEIALLQDLQKNIMSTECIAANDFLPELHKSSSGSIEVPLSSNCSQLTVEEIVSLLQKSIRTKASGLVSCEVDDAVALRLERPEEDIHIAVEVCPPTGPQGLKGLKIRRISGDYLRYDRICNELIACISM